VSSARVEWVLKAIETWNAGDVDGYLDALGDDFEFTPDPSFPDADTYSGEDWRRWMNEWRRTWAESRLEVLGVSEHGDAVVLESRWHLTAKTGAEVPNSDFNVVAWFEPGETRPTRAAAFFDRERALEEAAKPTG
jgi:ketosteroid isomerase-like protein